MLDINIYKRATCYTIVSKLVSPPPYCKTPIIKKEVQIETY